MNFKNIVKFTLIIWMLLLAQYSFAKDTTNIPDPNISSSVHNRLFADSSLSGTNIKVTTTNGVVSLSGNVDSETQASTATEIAQSTPGVQDVDTSHLTIKGSQQPVSDAVITAKIKGIFLQQKLFGDKDVAVMSIKVETNDGVVSLSGTADTQAQISNAIRLARSISGVKDVKSTIQITTSSQ